MEGRKEKGDAKRRQKKGKRGKGKRKGREVRKERPREKVTMMATYRVRRRKGARKSYKKRISQTGLTQAAVPTPYLGNYVTQDSVS